MSLNTYNPHPLIPRENTYVLDRKLLTVHSDDRDINKWRYANHFEITLPTDITNVQSLRLVEICFPANYYSFSNENQNTKFQFTITTGGAPAAGSYIITLQEGFYTPEELANEIGNRMNLAVQEAGFPGYNNFTVYNDSVGQKYWIGNDIDTFTLNFDVQMTYDISCSIPPIPTTFDHYTKWGLPFYIGFEKQEYTSTITTNTISFYYTNPITNWLVPAAANASFVTAPLVYKLFGENTIYMEMDKYNTIDELQPYSEATNNLYNNDFNGKVNAAFAKIPVTDIPYSQVFDSRNGFVQNVSEYNPPIEKIRKLKFKFRDHDGNLINFREAPVNFTLEFNRLKNEIGKSYTLRVPPALQR